MTVSVVFAVASVVALLFGITGGGIKVREFEIPRLSVYSRVVIVIVGFMLAGFTVWLENYENPKVAPNENIPSSNIPTASLTDVTISTSTYYSIKSYSSSNSYIRHKDYLGIVSLINSDLDKQDATFFVVEGLADVNCISLQSSNYPNRYLRHKNSLLRLDSLGDTLLIRKDATFCVKSGLANPEWVSFESYNYPGSFIRIRDSLLYKEENDGTILFKENATFKFVKPLWNQQ